MTIIQALILGIVQGITEFLPISSSAHLVLIPFLLKWDIPIEQAFSFDVLVQLGTLAAVIIYFWKDLIHIVRAFILGLIHKQPFAEPDARLGWYLILATIPAGIGGLFLKDLVEKAFNSPMMTAFFLFGTAILLILSERIGQRRRGLNDMNWKDALWIGAAQLLAIFPGISRSGSTIAGGLSRNFKRTDTARFSFLMSIPIMLAAGLLSLLDLKDMAGLSSFLPALIIGFLSAAVVGYLSIAWLLSFLNRRTLTPFAIYCVAAALITLLVGYVF